jgi:hypothetical protein
MNNELLNVFCQVQFTNVQFLIVIFYVHTNIVNLHKFAAFQKIFNKTAYNFGANAFSSTLSLVPPLPPINHLVLLQECKLLNGEPQ